MSTKNRARPRAESPSEWRRGWLLLTLLGAASTAGGAERNAVPEFQESLDSVVPALAAKYRTPGVAIALLRAGEPTRFHVYGVADSTTNRAVTPDTAFQVGSISKLVFSTLVARLAQQGRIDYDAPIARYLRSGTLPAAPDFEQVTMRRLLSHSAGLAAVSYLGRLERDTSATLGDSLLGRPNPGTAVRIVRRPGSVWMYSGANYALVQQAVQDVTGRRLPELARRELFIPLGMTHASFAAEFADGEDVAAVHNPDGTRAPRRYFTEESAASLTISARDLATFMQSVLLRDDSKSSIPSATRTLLTTPISPAAGEPSSSPFTIALAPEAVREPLVARYGVGPLIYSLPDGRRLIGHGGSIWGTKAWAMVVPESGEGIVVLANGEAGNGVLINVLCRWRRALDGAGMAQQNACHEHGHSYLHMLYATEGIESAIDGIRAQFFDPNSRLFISERTATDVAGAIVAFSTAANRAQALADALRLTALNVELFPESPYAHASLASAYVARGDLSAARAQIDCVLYLNPAGAAWIGSLTDSIRPRTSSPSPAEAPVAKHVCSQ